MLKRIVRMTFKEDQIENFIEHVFNPSKHLIRNFEGCKHLELHQDKNKSNILYTYSIWDSEASLELYRNSEFQKYARIKNNNL